MTDILVSIERLSDRRLAKDWENLNRKALAFLRLASIRLMLRKLCNPALSTDKISRPITGVTAATTAAANAKVLPSTEPPAI
jgi:hypothetical protein